jgi:hypothetical protein
MSITYAGVELSVANPEVAVWVESAITVADVYEFSRLHWPGLSGITFPGTLQERGQPDRPVKLGSLWWPKGVSRWAVGHFLVTKSELDQIRPVVYQNGTGYISGLFTMDDEDTGTPAVPHQSTSIQTYLFMLPPRPLAQNAVVGTSNVDDELYLLTLVDERYFLWRPAAQLFITENKTTWKTLYNALAVEIGITLTIDPIAPAYLFPSGQFSTFYEHVPPILDAVAYNVGQRIVRQLDGTYKAESATTALADELTNLGQTDFADSGASPWKKLAGGLFRLRGDQLLNDLNSLVPSFVDVVFPGTGCDGAYISTVSLKSLNIQEYGQAIGDGTVQVFKDSANAIYQNIGDALPCNQAELDALAQQFATDWYKWQLGRLDLKLISPALWTMEGIDDSVEFIYNRGEMSTRIERAPWNDLTNILMHASSNCCCSVGSSSSSGSGSSSSGPCKPCGPSKEPIDVRITQSCFHDCGTSYAWVEVCPAACGTWAVKQFGMSGDCTLNTAYERNHNSNVPVGTYAKLWKGYRNPDCTKCQEYVFDYCCNQQSSSSSQQSSSSSQQSSSSSQQSSSSSQQSSSSSQQSSSSSSSSSSGQHCCGLACIGNVPAPAIVASFTSSACSCLDGLQIVFQSCVNCGAGCISFTASTTIQCIFGVATISVTLKCDNDVWTMTLTCTQEAQPFCQSGQFTPVGNISVNCSPLEICQTFNTTSPITGGDLHLCCCPEGGSVTVCVTKQ